MSESLWTVSLITLSGGLQDAYTYFARNKVFANAQTGNIVLMASHLCDGDIRGALRYLIPLAAFALGIAAAEQIDGAFHRARRLHWRQIVLLCEIVLLLAAGLIPSSLNYIATSCVSFACAMQVQAFRKMHGNAYASTMCIGNIRAGVSWLSRGIRLHDRNSLHHSAYYFFVILLFTIGAACGYILVQVLALHAVWVSCFLLAGALGLMFIQFDLPGEQPE